MKLRHLFLTTLGLCTMSGLALANDFPVKIEHKYGETVIKSQPQRVATLDYSGADDLLALGVQPVVVRYWHGDNPRAVWPWADKLLEGNPTIIKSQIDFEALAAAKPDVILALWSGITAEDYKKLSAIAPVVAVPKGVGDYSLPWDTRAIKAAEALGLKEKAEEKVAEVKEQFKEFKMRHPNWNGKTATVAFYWNGAPGAYAPEDVRPSLLSDLGFKFNPKMLPLIKDGAFFATISEEQLGLLDSDILLWTNSEITGNLDDLKGRRFLKAVKEGREIPFNNYETAAFSHATLLSLPIFLNIFEEKVTKALGK